ncbi:MAG: hypothetical protein WAZ12_03935 [Candidatus Absconditicoccaceae bacterium]
MFINISSDKVYIGTGDKNIFLDRNGIENVLGSSLIKLYKKNKIKDILVLNGPGGFTNLRVSTLCLNLLNTLEKDSIKIYDISKINLYNHLYDKNLIPRYGIIYIGQRKNIRLYDFQKQKYTTQTIEDTDLDSDYFLDQVYEKGYYGKLNDKLKIKINYKKIGLEITYKSKIFQIKIKDLNLKPLKQIQPNYMIDPKMN